MGPKHSGNPFVSRVRRGLCSFGILEKAELLKKNETDNGKKNWNFRISKLENIKEKLLDARLTIEVIAAMQK